MKSAGNIHAYTVGCIDIFLANGELTMKAILKKLCIGAVLMLAAMSIWSQDTVLDVSESISISAQQSEVDNLQWYSFDVQQGQILNVEVVSLDFTPYIQVKSANGEVFTTTGEGNSAQYSIFPQQSGSWQVGVGYVDARKSGSGSFFLKISSTQANSALQVGRIHRGTLSGELSYEADYDRYVKWYPFMARASQPVQVLLESNDFDAYLFIRYPDGSIETFDDGRGTDSVASIFVTQDSPLYIGASSYSGSDEGEFSIHLEGVEERDDIEVGQTLNGYLEGTSDYYSFVARESQAITINLGSEEFDAILRVRGAGGIDLEDDDSGSGTDSTLALSLNAGDEIMIEVSSWGDTGTYALNVVTAQEVSVGQTLRRTLGEGDSFILNGREGDFITLEMVSDEFDTYLTVVDEDGNQSSDDDSYVDDYYYASIIHYMFNRNESLVITASSYGGYDGGDYILRITESDIDLPDELPQGHKIDMSGSVQGFISGNEEYYDVGPGDMYTIEATEGEQIRLIMTSDDLDSYVTLLAPNGQSFSDDDSYGDLNSQLEVVAPLTGTYQVIASAYSGDSGVYELSYESQGRVNVIYEETGSLESSDERDIRGGRYDVIEQNFRAGQSLSIMLSSDAFDTRLYINGPDGEAFADNDDYNGTDSRVDIEIEQSGTYQIVVTPYYDDDRGEYHLQIVEW